MAPTVSQLIADGILTPQAVSQLDAYEAGVQWACTEGFIPAPETTNALACVVSEAKKAKDEGREKVIFLNFSGHGLPDLGAYEKYLSRELVNFEFDEAVLTNARTMFESGPKTAILRSKQKADHPCISGVQKHTADMFFIQVFLPA